MSELALTVNELMRWSDETFLHWEQLLAEHPSALDLPCDIYKTTQDVRGLLFHIVAVELRYAERLMGEPVSSPEQVAAQVKDHSVEAIFSIHRRTLGKFRALGDLPDQDSAGHPWTEVLEFHTLTAGTIRASRRKIFFHALMHGIRHFAQLATLVRQHDIKPGWPMDFLGSAAME